MSLSPHLLGGYDRNLDAPCGVCYTVFYYIQATCSQMMMMVFYCYIGKRPRFEGKTENGGICAKKRIRVKAVVLMARQLPAKEIAQK